MYNCWCPSGFHGLRCDYKYIAHQFQQQVGDQSLSEQYNQLVAMTLSLDSNSETKTKEGKLVREKEKLSTDFHVVDWFLQ